MLLLQVAAAADTLIVRQASPIRTGLEQVLFVVSGLTSVLALVLIAVTIVLLFSLRAKAEETRVRLDELLVELRPLTRNANALVDEVSVAAQNVNEIVERSRKTVEHADARVRQSVDGLMDRVDDVSALIGRVHASAEKIESVATTTVAGIKFGARALGLSKKRSKQEARTKAPVERPRLRRRD